MVRDWPLRVHDHHRYIDHPSSPHPTVSSSMTASLTSPDAWLSDILPAHPIFTLPQQQQQRPHTPNPHLDASTSSSAQLTAPSRSGTSNSRAKRNIMVVRGGDLIVAVDKEIRMCSLAEAKSSGGKASYKVCWPPRRFGKRKKGLKESD